MTRKERMEMEKTAEKVQKEFNEQSERLLASFPEHIAGEIRGSMRYKPERGKWWEELTDWLKQPGNKPSDFFRRQEKDFHGWISEDLLEDFYYSLDHEKDWCVNRGKRLYRSFRTDTYYSHKAFEMMKDYHIAGIYGADIVSVLRLDLPSEQASFRRCEGNWCTCLCDVWIAAELDRGNKGLEEVLTEIICGDNNQNTVTNTIIHGIIMSHNHGMHELLGKLLLAARLQEGLRQSICEYMDSGTVEAFLTLYQVVVDNNLLRYSSVMRAIGTWTGILAEEEKDLNRITEKQAALIGRYVAEEEERKNALKSEDAMEIYLALWSYGVYDLKKEMEVLEELIQNGSRHQRMVAFYALGEMDLPELVHPFARRAFFKYHGEMDLTAVLMRSFMPKCYTYVCNRLEEARKKTKERLYWNELSRRPSASVSDFFEDEKQCCECYRILKQLLEMIPKKKLEFSSCLFPWNTETLSKSDLILRMAVCANALGDEEKMMEVAGMLPGLHFGINSSYSGRSTLLSFLMSFPVNTEQKMVLVKALSDQEEDTREEAYRLLLDVELEEIHDLMIEDMLKYKKSDLRTNLLRMLYKREDGQLYLLIKRLLSDGKVEKRMAGLDLLLQLKKDENRQETYRQCVPLADSILKPTTKEEILLDEIRTEQMRENSRENGYGLYDVSAVYEPQLCEGYLEQCRKEFHECFAKDNEDEILDKLEKLIDEHKYDEYTDEWGQVKLMCYGSGGSREFYVGANEFPFMELWEEFYQKEIKDYDTCLRLRVRLAGSMDKEDHFTRYCEDLIARLFGARFTKGKAYEYFGQMSTALERLAKNHCDCKRKKRFVVAAMYEMLHWDRSLIEEYEPEGVAGADGKQAVQRFRVTNHKKIACIMEGVDIDDTLEPLEKTFPLYYRFSQASESENEMQMRYLGGGKYKKYLNVAHFIAAYCKGIITKDFLYKCILETADVFDHLKDISIMARYYIEKNRHMSDRRGNRPWMDSYCRRRLCCLLGHEVVLQDMEWGEEDERRLSVMLEIYETISSLIVNTELVRGDTATPFSRHVFSLNRIYGAEYFVRILSALGQDALVRSYIGLYYMESDKVGRQKSLSYLLSICMPAQGDTAETLASLLEGTDISEKRLVEAAFYSPEWISVVGEYLGWDGFESGCYYFMAHMKQEHDDRYKAIIARYTPLTMQELQDGAFDSNWFREVYRTLGEKRFAVIYEAAKYISYGARHRRARMYADACVGKLADAETRKEISEKRNKDLVMAYGLIPIKSEKQQMDRYLFLQQFKKESRQFGSQRRNSEGLAVEMALQNMATNAGYHDVTRLTLKMEGKIAEKMKSCFSPKDVEGVTVWLETGESGKCELICERAGKRLKAVPARLKKNEYIQMLTENKKQLTEQYRRTRQMLEEAMETEALFDYSEVCGMMANPVMMSVAGKLVWKCGEFFGFLQVAVGEEGDGADDLQVTNSGEKHNAYVLVDPAGDYMNLREEDQMAIAHPYHLYRHENWHLFQKQCYDSRICQPFKQVFRELYIKTEEEMEWYHSLRYAGNQLQKGKTIGCLKGRRWVADVETGLQKVYYKENIVARLYALADWFSPAEIESPTLEWVVFVDRRTGEELKIADIPELLFSEVMRDVDMAVSTAHAGGVDPEASHSTIEMRKSIAEFTMPLFKLTNVTFRENHAIIAGKRADYSVHLGSGVVHVIGGPMLVVLPVHSERRGRIFLPFVDEDPKTAEILTKILFFAEDEKIKDPSILAQYSSYLIP